MEQSLDKSLLIFEGSALGRLTQLLGLDGSGSTQILRRVLLWIGLLWLPPVLASGFGSLTGGEDLQPSIFLDLAFHVRYLFAIPLLLIIERRLQAEYEKVVPAVLSREIIRNEKLPVFYKTVEWVRRLETFFWTDIILFGLAILMVLSRLYVELPDAVVSWKTADSLPHVFAQSWNFWVSLPFYYFFVFRWVWRFFLWGYFLVRLGFLGLNLKSLHPDRVGGLAFLNRYHKMFGFVAVAVSSVASANIATLVWFGGASIDHFLNPILLFVFIFDVIITLPLAAFTPLLIVKRNQGLIKYSRLGNSYADKFDRKWLTQNAGTENVLGNPDFQSLNDLHGSYRSLVQMRISLMDTRTLTAMTILLLAPLAPLSLFKIPVLELVRTIARYFFKI